MVLAHMVNTDRDALECDLAETYHIYDMRALPLSKVALFSVGLRENSRIKMAMNESKVTLQESLTALAVDSLNLLAWSKTQDAENGKNPPESVYEKLTRKQKTSNAPSFKTMEEFEKAWEE